MDVVIMPHVVFTEEHGTWGYKEYPVNHPVDAPVERKLLDEDSIFRFFGVRVRNSFTVQLVRRQLNDIEGLDPMSLWIYITINHYGIDEVHIALGGNRLGAALVTKFTLDWDFESDRHPDDL